VSLSRRTALYTQSPTSALPMCERVGNADRLPFAGAWHVFLSLFPATAHQVTASELLVQLPTSECTRSRGVQPAVNPRLLVFELQILSRVLPFGTLERSLSDLPRHKPLSRVSRKGASGQGFPLSTPSGPGIGLNTHPHNLPGPPFCQLSCVPSCSIIGLRQPLQRSLSDIEVGRAQFRMA